MGFNRFWEYMSGAESIDDFLFFSNKLFWSTYPKFINVMIGYPTTSTIRSAKNDDRTPTFKKSGTVSHGTPVGSSKEMAFIFGKELTGRPSD